MPEGEFPKAVSPTWSASGAYRCDMMKDDATPNEAGTLRYDVTGCQELMCEQRVRSFWYMTWGKWGTPPPPRVKPTTASDLVINPIVQIFEWNSCSEPLACFSLDSLTAIMFHLHAALCASVLLSQNGLLCMFYHKHFLCWYVFSFSHFIIYFCFHFPFCISAIVSLLAFHMPLH